MSRIPRYVPSIGTPDWDIKSLSKEEMANLKKRLALGMTDNEEEYKHVISYMYTKFPHEMDLTKLPDGSANVPIQWNYQAGKNKVKLHNMVTGMNQDMYAFIVYDSERDYEPVAFAGSYFEVNPLVKEADDEANSKWHCNADGKLNPSGKYQRVGYGIVMFVDPAYRRLGLATDLWYAEAKLYQESLAIRYQREIQNEYSLKSTQAMFSDPSKCIITSNGRIKNDGTRSQIRCLLDYSDIEVMNGWLNLPNNLSDVYAGIHVNYQEREGGQDLIKRLDRIWKAGKIVD